MHSRIFPNLAAATKHETDLIFQHSFLNFVTHARPEGVNFQQTKNNACQKMLKIDAREKENCVSDWLRKVTTICEYQANIPALPCS